MATNKPVRVSPGVRKLIAPNPGPMTGEGTNTYIVGEEHLSVIDPGPADPGHIEAIASACGGRLENILVTHTHIDHSPGAMPLAKLTGARVIGMPLEPDDGHQDISFTPDLVPEPMAVLKTPEYALQAIHTPGHVGNHVCYYLQQEKMIFAGDHMMEGSTVVIIPPSGDMADYIDSLRHLKSVDPDTIAPGHGGLIQSAKQAIDALIEHRLKREEKIYSRLKEQGPMDMDQLVKAAYDDVNTALHKVARYSLLAHLLKLEKEVRVARKQAGHWTSGNELWHCLDEKLA